MKRTRNKVIDPKLGVSVAEAGEALRIQMVKMGISLKTPDLILTADWHLRDDQPISRTDNFWDTQWYKVNQVAELQKRFDCPVVCAGDLFQHWKPSPWLLSYAIAELPKKFITVFGNHDIPQHNLELDTKSGVNVLRQAGVVSVLKEGSFGQEPGTIKIKGRKVGVWHEFVWDGKKIPWSGCDEKTSRQVLSKYPEFDLIVTGDHHKPFTQELKGRLLVNCGCLTRQASDYANHKPVVWLYYAETNTVEPFYLDVPVGVVSRDHIEKKEEADKRMDAFISRLSDEWEVGVSFEENLERFLSSNKVKNSVKELVYKAIDNES